MKKKRIFSFNESQRYNVNLLTEHSFTHQNTWWNNYVTNCYDDWWVSYWTSWSLPTHLILIQNTDSSHVRVRYGMSFRCLKLDICCGCATRLSQHEGTEHYICTMFSTIDHFYGSHWAPGDMEYHLWHHHLSWVGKVNWHRKWYWGTKWGRLILLMV